MGEGHRGAQSSCFNRAKGEVKTSNPSAHDIRALARAGGNRRTSMVTKMTQITKNPASNAMPSIGNVFLPKRI